MPPRRKQSGSGRGDGMSTDATNVLAPLRLSRPRTTNRISSPSGAPAAATSERSRPSTARWRELQLSPADTVVISGIGCSSRLPGLRRDVRVQRRARPRPAARHRRQGRSARADRHCRRRRRRRNRDRRQPFPPLRAAQPRRRVHAHGQRDLRADQGPGRAHDGSRRQDQVHDVGQPRAVRRSVRARDLLRRDVGRPRLLGRPEVPRRPDDGRASSIAASRS